MVRENELFVRASKTGNLIKWEYFYTHFVFFRTKAKTYHDVIPISCLTEFPNVVQMAKVSS